MFNPLLFLCFLGGYCLVNYILIWIQRKTGLYKYGISWLILVWILVLFFSQIAAFLTTVIDPSFLRLRYLVTFIFVFSLLVYVIKRRVGYEIISGLNYLVNVFVLILTGLIIFSGVQIYLKEKGHNFYLQNRKLPSLKIKDNKDIVWILLDEYASPASLKSQFNFKDSLVDSLGNKGFYVFENMNSRSDTTVYSVNSLFNLDDSVTISNYANATVYLNQSSWINHLTKFGYDFISLDFLNIGGHPKLQDLKIFPDNYIGQVLNGTLFISAWDSLFLKHKMPYDDYNQMIVSKFNKNMHLKRSRPVFTWTHLLIPHTPFYRDAHGRVNEHPIEVFDAASSKEVTRQYTSYLSYANTVVLKMLNGIPDWKNKIIIISGDHGARMLVPEHDPRRKKTFCAIYYPGMDKLKISKIKYMQQIPFYLH
ncbi:hypothetical protein [Pedobacter cryoconitis]|uniref:hypothetical protein n=1 Tax=Pedobacter cryoconitis TaxID=188932 RepID=UPI001609C2E5|nr:hypothetical protein [Pedobacter cryoconitis]